MKSLAFVCLLMIAGFLFNDDLIDIRNAYADAAKNKKGLQRLQQILKNVSARNTQVIRCYQGAATMMDARYSINPFSKLSAFSKGREMIEKALISDSAGIECNFIRYGIQRNVPAMLNYHDQLTNDSLAIVKGLDTLHDEDLKKRIIAYMKIN